MERIDAPLYSHQTRIANSSASHFLLGAALQAALQDDPPEQALIESLPTDYGRRSVLEKCQYLEMATLLRGFLLNTQGDRMLSATALKDGFLTSIITSSNSWPRRPNAFACAA